MFSGIVAGMGRVAAINQSPAGVRLHIVPPAAGFGDIKPGDSVCVSGVCLTHAPGSSDSHESPLVFDVIPETLARTTLGALTEGARVNLERSVRASGMLDGHIVQGHVEGVGEVTGVAFDADGCRVRVRAPRELMECVTPKGSVTLDGVSLTIAGVDVENDEFEVALIPTTLKVTTLGSLQSGSGVNIETDIVGRTVVHWVKNYGVAPR
ncbi:MAG: riboflavin synthase [Phycisphaeraceae bacterium]|nr:riboflavin synthase [Phycisphaeraceae bacterium]MCB9847465.1 riboflavin synthase [Phycisphaeraceae bacterium]